MQSWKRKARAGQSSMDHHYQGNQDLNLPMNRILEHLKQKLRSINSKIHRPLRQKTYKH